MSDSSNPTRSSRWWLALRALLAGAFAVGGVAAVWQGFGLIGYGTDIHPLRLFTALALLFVAGLIILRPRANLVVRGLASGTAVGAVCAVWWFVPCEFDGLSLRQAVDRRNQLRARLASTSPDDVDSGIAVLMSTSRLGVEYPKLAEPVYDDLRVWPKPAAESIAAHFQRLSLGDVRSARALEERARIFAIHFSEFGPFVGAAVEGWTDRAIALQQSELANVPHGDWVEFDRTAAGRIALAEVGTSGFAAGTREVLAKVEEEWVNASVEALVERHGRSGTRAQVWRAVEAEILALNALDTEDYRFLVARVRLFDLAHEAVRVETDRLIQARRYHAALGVARRHAVEWNATATALGERDIQKLDALREKCADLVAAGVADPDPADEPDIAPPPRPKP